jgi:hypothetical protein
MKKGPNQLLQHNAIVGRFLFANATHRVADRGRSAE